VDAEGKQREPESGLGALPRAVHQGIAEVRWRNAVVVAWARVALRLLTLSLLLLAMFGPRGVPVDRWVAVLNGGHLVVAGVALLLLARRWRTELVAPLASLTDVAMVFGWGIHATAPGNPPMSLAVLGGAMWLALLFAVVSLPTRIAGAMAAAAVVYQFILGVRVGVSPGQNLLGTFTAAIFALVAIWTGVRMVRLAAGMAVKEITAELAEHHAEALEAAHAEVAAQRDRLIAAQNEAEALAQVIVHDLKNPLATLLQYVSLAENELKALPGSSGVLDYLGHAADEGRRLSKLIGDLLLVYRLEQGVMAPTREPVPVALLLDGVARRFGARAAERGVRLELQADEALMAALDLDLVQRLLENLVSNAMRHVGRGDHVSLEARSVGGELQMAVRNSGPPVPEELRERLFRRFVTGGLREWQNAGLGLYLCRLVAEAHGGSIALADRQGWNVSFEVAIPAPREPAARPARAPAEVSGEP
jgi:signal transduction histidine kinase